MQTDLLKNSIFEFLDEKECQTLLSCAKERSIQAGEILASENEPAENFFAIIIEDPFRSVKFPKISIIHVL